MPMVVYPLTIVPISITYIQNSNTVLIKLRLEEVHPYADEIKKEKEILVPKRD